MKAEYTLRPDVDLTTLYLYRDAIDFSKSHRGISMIVQMDFGHELFTGVLYVFRNRTSTKLKILFWENNGFVLYYKTLAEEEFHWPSSSDAPLTITSEQLKFLVNSYVISRMKQHKTLRNDSVC